MGIFCFLRGRVNNDYFLGILINRQGLPFIVLGDLLIAIHCLLRLLISDNLYKLVLVSLTKNIYLNG